MGIKDKEKRDMKRNLWSLGFNSYWEYLQSYMWESKRDLMLELFPLCYKCKEKATHVHHKHYERLGNEGIRDLITLCKKCHKKEHDGK